MSTKTHTLDYGFNTLLDYINDADNILNEFRAELNGGLNNFSNLFLNARKSLINILIDRVFISPNINKLKFDSDILSEFNGKAAVIYLSLSKSKKISDEEKDLCLERFEFHRRISNEKTLQKYLKNVPSFSELNNFSSESVEEITRQRQIAAHGLESIIQFSSFFTNFMPTLNSDTDEAFLKEIYLNQAIGLYSTLIDSLSRENFNHEYYLVSSYLGRAKAKISIGDLLDNTTFFDSGEKDLNEVTNLLDKNPTKLNHSYETLKFQLKHLKSEICLRSTDKEIVKKGIDLVIQNYNSINVSDPQFKFREEFSDTCILLGKYFLRDNQIKPALEHFELALENSANKHYLGTICKNLYSHLFLESNNSLVSEVNNFISRINYNKFDLKPIRELESLLK